MSARSASWLLAGMLLVSAGSGELSNLYGQSPGKQPDVPYTLKATAQTVTLDVVVTDKSGNPVKHLTKDDFAVFDDGKPRATNYFHAYEPPDPALAPHSSSLRALDRSHPDVAVTIIVLDEFSLSFADQGFATYSLQRFLSRQGDILQQPTMLASANLKQVRVLSDYTTSRQQILDALRHHLSTYSWPTRGNDLGSDQINTSLSTLVSVAESTIGHPGRKNVLWIGRGFPVVTSNALDPISAASLTAALHTCINLLVQARITLYTVDPAGLGSASMEVDQEGFAAADPLAGDVNLATIAKSTGGESFAGRNDVDRLIGNVTKDAQDFYTVAYTPDLTSPAEQAFHSIRIVMKDGSLHAKTRAGYYAVPSASTTETSRTERAQDRSLYDLDVAARNTLLYDGVPLQVSRGAANPDLFTFNIPGSALTWQDASDGGRTATITLLVESFDVHGNLQNHTAKSVSPHYSPGAIPATIRVLMQLSSTDKAARLRFAVRDSGSGKVGTDNLVIAASKSAH